MLMHDYPNRRLASLTSLQGILNNIDTAYANFLASIYLKWPAIDTIAHMLLDPSASNTSNQVPV